MVKLLTPSLLSLFITVCCSVASGQPPASRIDSFRLYGDVKVTIDRPAAIKKGKETIISFFALPNGNSTEQTMGKKIQPGEDWHFDIQHIRAQTAFIRKQLPKKNFIVIYLENTYRSWPSWKQKHTEFKELIPHMVDSLTDMITKDQKSIYLNGHSGGGSFYFWLPRRGVTNTC